MTDLVIEATIAPDPIEITVEMAGGGAEVAASRVQIDTTGWIAPDVPNPVDAQTMFDAIDGQIIPGLGDLSDQTWDLEVRVGNLEEDAGSDIDASRVQIDTTGWIGSNVPNPLDAQAGLTAFNQLVNGSVVPTLEGLGSAATRDVGTTAGTVAAGDDARFTTVSAVTTATAYTVSAADAGKVIECTGAVTVTLPSGLTGSGQIVDVCRTAAGDVTIAVASPGTLRSPDGKVKIAKQWGTISCRHRGSGEWVLVGALA